MSMLCDLVQFCYYVIFVWYKYSGGNRFGIALTEKPFFQVGLLLYFDISMTTHDWYIHNSSCYYHQIRCINHSHCWHIFPLLSAWCVGTIMCFRFHIYPAHDDVIKWKHFPRNWPFVRGIHRSRWFPHTKASDMELWCYLWSEPELTDE